MVTSRFRLAIGELFSHSANKAPLAVLLVAALAGAPAAAQASKPVHLRVVNTAGKTLAEQRQYTSSVKIKTDPHAKCFGQGTGGSGKRVAVPGATALGAVRDALAWRSALRPLSVTDAFASQGFGLGVCGIGGFDAQGSAFWYLKVSHVGAQVSGSELKVHRGENVLWYLTPSYPPADELLLRAPASAQPGVPYQVTVSSFADDGTRSRAAGADVTGAAAPTDVNGHALVTSPSAGTDRLQATDSPEIPSNRVAVCVRADPSKCPAGHEKDVFGTSHDDRIAGTKGLDRIKAGGGDDVIDVRSGGPDRINCGGGRDRVITKRGDRDNQVASNCERVVRR